MDGKYKRYFEIKVGWWGRWFGADALIQKRWWGIHVGPMVLVVRWGKRWTVGR
jgi:hypothetical protein